MEIEYEGDDEEYEEPAQPYGTNHKLRMLTEQCTTCIFRPGNPMHLSAGRVRGMVKEALQLDSFIICHDTLDYSAPEGFGPPAVCRGFADRYSTNALRIFGRLGGYEEIDPPRRDKK